jgi:hypothetical protein
LAKKKGPHPGKKPEKQQKSDELAVASARLVVEVAAQQRADRACIQRVALLPPASAISKALLQAGHDYYDKKEKAKSNKEQMEQENDFPFVYVWQALILALKDSKEGDLLSAEERTAVLAHSSQMATPEDVLEHVRVCKAKLTHTNDAVKLVVSVDFSLQPLAAMIFAVFKRMGSVVKYGPAPPSTNERALKSFLRQY